MQVICETGDFGISNVWRMLADTNLEMSYIEGLGCAKDELLT